MSSPEDFSLDDATLEDMFLRRDFSPVMYKSPGRNVYDLGDGVCCKEFLPAAAIPESSNIAFVRGRTDIPAPAVFGYYRKAPGFSGYFMQKMEGQPLEDVWRDLNLAKRKRIADQLGECLRVMRVMNASYIGGIKGDIPIREEWLFRHRREYGPFRSTDKFWEAITAEDELVVELSPEALAALRRRMPECEPFTFSHGDLHMGNIMVNDGKIVALIDWETAGYYPVWWEYAKVMHSRIMHPLWRRLVTARMQRHPDGYEFMKLLHILQGHHGIQTANDLNIALSRDTW